MSRGRERLSRASVLAEAMRLLDEEGLDSLTMRRLADRLGVVPMAVYRHVADKDDLLEALLDAAVAEVALPDSTTDWRAGLEQLAHAVRATMLAHPALVTTLVARPSLGPHAIRIGEYGFAVMRAGGFAAEDVERGPAAVLTYTIGFVALEIPRRAAGFGADGSGGEALDAGVEALDPAAFPHTHAIRPRAAEFVSDRQFAYGLAQVLDGIGVRAPASPPPRRRRAAADEAGRRSR